MAVDIQPDGTPTGPRHEVLRIPERFSPQMCLPNRCFDIAADGRFLFIDRSVPKRETIPRIDLVLNWTSTLAASR
jgi:hypothetical protein